MRSVHVFVLCALVSAVFCNNSVGPEDCCFKHYSRKLSPNLFKSYDVTDNRCPIMGVILLTKKNNRICANPSHSWVNRIMRILDEAVL